MSKPTFEQRCLIAEQCLPDAPYRDMLKKLHTEMLEALAEPAPGRAHYEDGDVFQRIAAMKKVKQPAQRKPLTDEQIDALAIDKDGLPNSHLEFARAIEAAYGIKGDA